MSNTKTGPVTKQILEDVVPTAEKPHVGTFVVFDTPQVKGLRINLDKIRTYARNQEDSIQISYDSGQGTTLKYANAKDTDEAMDRLDSYCL